MVKIIIDELNNKAEIDCGGNSLDILSEMTGAVKTIIEHMSSQTLIPEEEYCASFCDVLTSFYIDG